MIVLEAFEGQQVMGPLSFYTYRIYSYTNLPINHLQIEELKNLLLHQIDQTVFQPLIIAYEKVWVLRPLRSYPPIAGIRLIEEGRKQADYVLHKQVYIGYIEQGIDFAIKHTVSCQWLRPHYVRLPYLYETGSKLKNHQGIAYERQIYYKADMNAYGNVQLLCHISGILRSDKNIYELMCQGEQVENLPVQYDWSSYGGIGRITKVLKVPINQSEILEYKGEKVSLLDYYRLKGQADLIQHFTARDEAACIVEASFSQKTYQFIPHSLTPIMTRELLAQKDPIFSKKIQAYMKLNMQCRFKVLQSVLKTIQNEAWPLPILFEETHFGRQLTTFGYQEGFFEPPFLKGKRVAIHQELDPVKEKDRIFKEGFYKESRLKYSFCFYYPDQMHNEVSKLAKVFEDFIKKGMWQGRMNRQIAPCLLTQLKPIKDWQFCSYSLEQEAKGELPMIKKEDLFWIIIIPDESQHLYDRVKKLGASYKCPSQVLTFETVQKIINGEAAAFYLMKNLVLGILTKTGGIPWLPEKMPGDVSCFMGLDVGMKSPGQHQAACSLVFNEQGEVLAYYKPSILQQGEKITPEVIAEIFDKMLRKYKAQYHCLPKHLVIHRDGFNNESIEWYKSYLGKRKISFDLLEIKKWHPIKLARESSMGYLNPMKGTYLIKEDTAYLITTQIDNRKGLGSPCPIQVEKKYGPTDFICLLQQIYYLAEMHVGAFQNTRLPITTAYADRMCKAADYIPDGKIDNKLFFL